ncbi:MAG: hypothetical protein C0518_05400 [Opitutus sp.]|nr:hypothetical protein [Opitutus sp.]
MENSKIEWTDHTFNPWIGCTKVSPGCAHCYAETLMDTRYGRVKWGKGQPRQRTSDANWRKPVQWNRQAPLFLQCENGCRFQSTQAGLEGFCPKCGDPQADSVRPRVFCASLADWLDDEVPIELLADLLRLIHRTQNLDWLLLTKRPENWRARMEAVKDYDGDNSIAWNWTKPEPNIPDNVWIGTTVEDQERADLRIPAVIQIPARVRFLSCEPLLGPVDLSRWLDPVGIHCADVCPDDRYVDRKVVRTFKRGDEVIPLCQHCGLEAEWTGYDEVGIHWVICGGESGPGARPMLIEWADSLRRQCVEADVAFFMKQLGAHVGTTNANAHDWPEHVTFEEVKGTPQFAGARVILSDKKGGRLADFPSELQVREFPSVP